MSQDMCLFCSRALLVAVCCVAPIRVFAVTPTSAATLTLALAQEQQDSPRQSVNPVVCKSLENGPHHTPQELADEANKYSFAEILAGNTAAVCNIEEIFRVTSQTELKERIASTLMRIGIRDQVYFDFLAAQAEKALEIDIPWTELFDPKTGKATEINPAFVRWCEKHKLNPEQAFEDAKYKVPLPWLYLASAGDQRAFNIFLKGLQAENKMIVGYAALGLAKLQNSSAIDPLIAATSETTIGVKYQIAQALWFFNDPKAQAAADALAQSFAEGAEARLGEKIPVSTLRKDYTKGGPQGILAFEGLLPPSSPLLANNFASDVRHPPILRHV